MTNRIDRNLLWGMFVALATLVFYGVIAYGIIKHDTQIAETEAALTRLENALAAQGILPTQ